MKNIKSIRIFSNENKEFSRIINNKHIKSNVSIVKIPKDSILYQGTDFDFDRIKKEQFIDKNI